jgi:hypothetical protein
MGQALAGRGWAANAVWGDAVDISHLQHKLAVRNPAFHRKIDGRQETFLRICGEVGGEKIGRKLVPCNAVKPFGNSQKGIRKGRLTCIMASDKYPGIK